MKFNDHIGYRRSEVNKYILGQEIYKYLREKARLEKKDSPLIASGFSVFVTLSLWVSREVLLDADTSNQRIIKIVVVAFGFAFVYVFAYILYVYLINPLIMKALRKFDQGLGIESPISLDVLMSNEQRSIPYLLDKFNTEVVGQISSAISMIEQSKDDGIKDAAKDFYISEGFRLVQGATSALLKDILMVNTFIIDDKEKCLSKSRVEELIPILKEITNEAKDYWARKGDSRIQECNDVIKDIDSISHELMKKPSTKKKSRA